VTIIAAFATPGWGAMVADSRVTLEYPAWTVYQDVARKAYSLGSHGVIGFAGNVCPSRTLVATAQQEVNDKGYAWLLDHDLVAQFVVGAIDHHVRVLGHKQCQEHPVQLLAMFHVPQELDALPEVPDRMMALPYVVDARYVPALGGANVFIERKAFGAYLIGQDEPYSRVLGPEFVYALAEFGNFDLSGLLRRAVVAASILYGASAQLGLQTVGGLFQLWALSPLLGPSVVPYRYWMEVADGFGTRVEMRIETDGTWVQAHPPTGKRQAVGVPQNRVGTRIFDLRAELTRESPGVEPTPAGGSPVFEVLLPDGIGSLSTRETALFSHELQRWRDIERLRRAGYFGQ